MAKKAFDILPPRKKETHHHPARIAEKEKKKSGKTFWTLIFGLFLIGVIWLFVKNGEILNPSPPPTPSKTNGFELFDPQGDSTLTQNPARIQVINASGGKVTYQDIANMLIKQGFTIQKASEEPSASIDTIIYYRPDSIAAAQKAQSILSAKFNPTIQEKNDLDQNLDLSIIIGQPKP